MKRLNICLLVLFFVSSFPISVYADAYPEDITPHVARNALPFAAPYLAGDENAQLYDNQSDEQDEYSEQSQQNIDSSFADPRLESYSGYFEDENGVIIFDSAENADMYNMDDETARMNSSAQPEVYAQNDNESNLNEDIGAHENRLRQNQEAVSLNENNTGRTAEGIMPYSESNNPSTGMPEIAGTLIIAFAAIGAAPVVYSKKSKKR